MTTSALIRGVGLLAGFAAVAALGVACAAAGSPPNTRRAASQTAASLAAAPASDIEQPGAARGLQDNSLNAQAAADGAAATSAIDQVRTAYGSTGDLSAGGNPSVNSQSHSAGDAYVLAGTPTAQSAIPRGETLTPLYSPTSTPQPPTATPIPTATAMPSGTRPVIGGCTIFPADNSWNQDISGMPVDPNSANYIASIGAAGHLHADFGGGGAYGIPFIVVPQNQALVPINFVDYGDESDPGPYPIPLNAPIEGGGAGDAHVLALQQGACKLYEMFNGQPGTGAWNASSGAIFDLNSNALRPDSWTSADAAGLPILPGLVRYDEVQGGAINHAVRFTVNTVQRAWVHPATHYGTSTNVNTPPYGAKLRLRANFDLTPYHGQALVVLQALKRYGMIVADQGTSWYITGAADTRWDDEDLNQLKLIPGNAFDVVQLGPITHY